jgi:hypothetical protein
VEQWNKNLNKSVVAAILAISATRFSI